MGSSAWEGSRHRLLWVLRHAKSVRAPRPGGTDHDRVLTARGRRDAAALGRWLVSDLRDPQEELPRVVLCSTATRTVETAALALAAFGEPPPVLMRHQLYGAGPDALLREVQSLDPDVNSVMLVGHNPGVHQLVQNLTATHAVGTFPTCALALVSCRPDDWRSVGPGTGQLTAFDQPPFGPA